MNKGEYLVLLRSVRDRIEKSGDEKKWKLFGSLSELEVQALDWAISSLVGEEPPPTSGAPAEEAIKPVELNLGLLSADISKDQMLCLDFGTAMSKAFATNLSNGKLIELPIGRRAGQDDAVFPLVSSMFIGGDAKISFGKNAITESLKAARGTRQRFDSIKDILCKDLIRELDDVALDSAHNPTQVPLTNSDIITLYLAYFTDMACSELEDRGYGRYVQRRFTHPIFHDERDHWAKSQLEKMLTRAQVVSDTLHGQWDQSIDAQYAKALLDQVRSLEIPISGLIVEGIIEPVAAMSSRTRNFTSDDESRRLLVVVDVGAGTIDFTAFAEIHHKSKAVELWSIPSAT